MCSMASKTSGRTPVHSMTTSGGRQASAIGPGVVGGAEVAHQIGLEPGRHLVEDVDLEAPLHAEQRGQQADRARPR